jgi:hypothetical protein
MAQASANLRCIDWKDITEALMTGAICSAAGFSNFYELSRPVKDGEVIDYFMSNSWHDDAKVKWSKLTQLYPRP